MLWRPGGVSRSLWDREGSSQDRMSNPRAEAGVSQRKGREGANSLMTQSLELVGMGLELQSQVPVTVTTSQRRHLGLVKVPWTNIIRKNKVGE